MTEIAVEKDSFLSKITKKSNDVKKIADSTKDNLKTSNNLFDFKQKENNSNFLNVSLEEYNDLTESTIDLDSVPYSAVTPIAADSINYNYEDNGTKNGVIEYSKQRKTGDCWLLSGINAMSYCKQGQEIIKNALEYHDGYTTVHTAAGDYNVSDEELGIVRGLGQIYNQYSEGDDDMLILELAIEKVCDDAANKNFVIDYSEFNLMSALRGNEATTPSNSSLNGGWSGIATYLLSGNICQVAQDRDEENQFLDEFKKNNSNSLAMTASFKESIEVQDIEGKTINLIDDHEYAIKNVTDNSVTIVNPHDSSKQITLSRNTFLDNAINMEKTDFSDKSSKKNLIYYPSEPTEEKIGNTTYSTISYTDSQGRVLSKFYKDANCKFDNGLRCNFDENGELIDGSLGVYNQKGMENCRYLNKQDIQRIFDRDLLSYYDKYDLINAIPEALGKISDDKWDLVKGYINSTKTSEQFDADDLYNLSLLSKEDIELADKIFERYPDAKIFDVVNYADSNNIDRNVLYLSYYMVNSYSIIESITPEHLKGDSDDSLKGCLRKILYDFPQEESTEIYKNIVERQLVPNLYLNKQLSANDIYYLSQISDDKWDKVVEYLNSYPQTSGEEMYQLFA